MSIHYLCSFFNNSGYKDYLENAVAFNRKLNEERKMRLPYIDGQTGVAMRHYNSQRFKRERMPGSKPGQVNNPNFISPIIIIDSLRRSLKINL